MDIGGMWNVLSYEMKIRWNESPEKTVCKNWVSPIFRNGQFLFPQQEIVLNRREKLERNPKLGMISKEKILFLYIVGN